MRHLSRIVLLIVAALALLCSSAVADDGATLEDFSGGTFSASGYFSLGFLYGAGSRPDGLGTPVSTTRSQIASVTGNPAGLAYLDKGGVLIDVLPGINASLGSFIDLDEAAADMVDDVLEDMASPTLDPVYPSVDATAGQKTRLVAGIVAVRLGRVVIGAAIEEPMAVDFSLVNTGLEAFAKTVKDGGGSPITIELRAMADAAADLTLGLQRTTLSAGTSVTPSVAVGASLARYSGSASIAAAVRADGTVRYGGQEFSFNDPSDPWQNDLGMSAAGDYQGDALGWSFGASWKISERFVVDAAYVSAPKLTLSGQLTTVEDMLPALSGDGLELLDLSPTQPTLTEHEVKIEDASVHFQFPSYLGTAVTFGFGPFVTTLEYRRYTTGLYFEYEEDTGGVDLSDGIGAQLDLGPLTLGGGVMRATTIVGSDGEPESLMIPMANVGLGFGIGEHLRLDSTLLSASTEVLRISASYEF